MTKYNLTLASVLLTFAQAQECPDVWYCPKTDKAPKLDANHDDWANVPSFETPLKGMALQPYTAGNAVLKCMHDDEQIYFALEIPGEYRFNTEDNHLCAAIGTMFKVGAQATYYNMGGCPDAASGCANGVPDTCEPYRVDIGAHWELATTEQGVTYGMMANTAVVRSVENSTGTGNDPIANNDDEYAVHAMCRFDDDDEKADNEWSGAWKHTDPTEGTLGTYHFELARLLKTASTETDAQLTTGETYSFGVAFWDPYELPEAGWTDSGHYLTGCANNWVDLVLADAPAAPSHAVDFKMFWVALALFAGWFAY